MRKGTRLSCVAQVSEFAPGRDGPVGDREALVIAPLCRRTNAEKIRRNAGPRGIHRTSKRARRTCRAAGASGWRLRRRWSQQPDILLLDEPTNHLDLAGIKWLERLLQNAAFACVVVSHDRYFLENAANEMVELDRAYPDGFLRVNGNYSTFLEAKEEFLHAQRKQQEALANRVHTEIEWLRRGPKARTTKSKARIDKAHEMIGEAGGLERTQPRWRRPTSIFPRRDGRPSSL